MRSRHSNAFARHARLMRQPGPVKPVRMLSHHHASARHVRLSLRPGRTLRDAIVLPLAEAGITCASMTILGGRFKLLRYCVAPATPDGDTVAAYSEPRDVDGAWLIFGNATLGYDFEGRPLVHCHAALRTGRGEVRGGHVLPEESVVGDQTISVLVTSLDGFQLRQTFDEETNMPLFMPCKEVVNECD